MSTLKEIEEQIETLQKEARHLQKDQQQELVARIESLGLQATVFELPTSVWVGIEANKYLLTVRKQEDIDHLIELAHILVEKEQDKKIEQELIEQAQEREKGLSDMELARENPPGIYPPNDDFDPFLD